MFMHFACYINSALKSAQFPHANTQIPCHKQIQSVVTTVTWMFLKTSAITDHTQLTWSAAIISYTNKGKTCKA